VSNALAIGAVTAVLRDLLNNGLIDHDVTGSVGGNVTVTSLPPDRIPVDDGNEKTQLNWFLHQVTANQGWRNTGLPSRDQAGDRLTNPPLALDLHYLLTAYGEHELHHEIVLGYGMQVMHETPVLSRNAIRRSLAAPPPVTGSVLPPAQQALVAAELADQVEQIKICPETLSTEELSKLWTALQARFRPSAAYQVSVVLIEAKRSTRSALPVRMRNVKVFTWRQPVIDSVQAQSGPDAAIVEGSPLFLRGSQLRGQVTRVRFGDTVVALPAADVADDRIAVAVPAGLRAGVQSVQVEHRLVLDVPPPDDLPLSPSDPHPGFESNVAAFVLHPTIDPPPPAASSVTPTLRNGAPVVVDGVTLRSADVLVQFAPAVGRAQRVILFLNEVAPPATRPARSYSFLAPRDNGIVPPAQPDTATITFPVTFVAPGSYLVRVQVDGAESALQVDGTGAYAKPAITI